MSIDPELLKILVCPETKEPVEVADSGLIMRLNQQIEKGALLNHSGKSVTEKFSSGLLRSDGKRLYPIREDIPIMLIDEGIDL